VPCTCTVCGVGSKRTVRECVGLGGGGRGTQRSWISYGISVCVYIHSRCTTQLDGGWGLWKGEKKIRSIL